MKYESLLGLALELIEVVALPGAFPADARVGRFFRARRFLGSHDRRAIGDLVWSWLRLSYRARALWRAELGSSLAAAIGALRSDEDLARLEREQALLPEDGSDESVAEARRAERSAELRRAYLVDLLALAATGDLRDEHETLAIAAPAVQLPPDDGAWSALVAEASSEGFAAALAARAADAREHSATLDGADSRPVIDALAFLGSLPSWIAERLAASCAAKHATALAAAFLEPAPIDLRTNLQKKSRDRVREHLARETGKTVDLTPHSHMGLRMMERANLTATMASRHSWVEVQDEGSQIAVLAVDIQPRMTIVDACAGSGGKTLAIVDVMIRYAGRTPKSRDEGRVIACDIAKDKLAELRRRATETGVESRIEIVHIYPAGDLPAAIPDADVVFVDAPCSGLGTLRRNPELKRRYSPEDIAGFAAQQSAILERFAPRVKLHGTLVYVTCSFLDEECEAVARAFEAQHPEFAGHESLWAKKNLPADCIRGHRLRIDPVLTGTDAFFISVWERVAPAQSAAAPE